MLALGNWKNAACGLLKQFAFREEIIARRGKQKTSRNDTTERLIMPGSVSELDRGTEDNTTFIF